MGDALDKITIKGFKSIKSLEDFELKNLNVLIGGNGAGKSNFVDFFRLLSAMTKLHGLKEFIEGDADLYLYGGPKTTDHIEIRMSFGNKGYDFELDPTEDGFFLVNNEVSLCNNLSDLKYGSGNFDAQFLSDKDNKELGYEQDTARKIHQAIKSWQVYHFHDTGEKAGMRRWCDNGHNHELFTDASNIAPFLLYLKEDAEDVYQEIVESVRLVTPFFNKFILKPNKKDRLRLSWRQQGLKNYPMRPSQLSDGTIRFICLATALLQPNLPSTIVMDEPELGLHPYAIAILAELIKAASQKTQMIIATQSPALVDNFEPEDVIVVNREKGASTFKRLETEDLSEWLKEYSLGELWRRNIVAGGPVHE